MSSLAPSPWPARYCRIESARLRFGDRVDRLAPYLSASDPPADTAVAALAARSPREASRVVDRLLAHGPSADPAAPPELVDFVTQATMVPPWVDWESIERGGVLFRRAGVLGGIVLGARALVYGYASPGGNKPLVFTGRLREQAARRLNETGRFVQAVTAPGGMSPGGDGVHITLKVRLMHAQVRRMILASGRWQQGRWGVPINQHDLAATSLLFSQVTLEGLRLLGLHVTPEEAEDFMHLWRYVGHLMGVVPELLPGSEREARRLADLIAATQAPPDDDSRALVSALMGSGAEVGSPEERERARRFRPVAEGICRGLVGDEMGDGLGLGRTPWSLVVPAMRPLVGAIEQVRRRSPWLAAELLARGDRYWQWTLRRGAGGALIDFALPEGLGIALAPG